jgi:hypothetical protein
MPLDPTSSFPPVESIPPPKRSRLMTIVSVLAVVVMLVGLFALVRLASISFLADAAGGLR